MSAPSSHGRRSGDSDGWTASSHTYIAGNSGAYTDNGEGGSSPRRSQDSRPDTGATNGATTLASAHTLARESVQEEDVARRKQRIRRSGAFLLDSTFASGPRQRHAYQDARTEDLKGKRSSRKEGRQERVPRRRQSPSSSPGASGIDLVDPQEMDNNRLHVARARQSAYETHSPAIDPNQLVHMALNLSESRRRHINAGQLMASQPRAASGAQREAGSSNYGGGGSLRQYLSEQRRASRNLSPMGKSSPTRHMSTSLQRSGSIPFLSSQTINPSAATLARVDKARAYIELQIEYLRLLEYLPPLKPDANAPGNFVVSSNNMPGSPQAQLTRVPSYAGKQHQLGRPYNPLQYIRNRRSRARERLTLDHPSEEFEHVEHVHEWVDRVEQYAKHAAYRRDDAVQLPKLHPDHEVAPAPNKPARPHKGWLFTPQELLADAHWLEQGDNKMLVENRHGRKIFPPREVQQKDLLHPRASIETSDKRRKSWIDGLPTIALDPTTGDESDKGSERGRKRRLLPALRTDSPKGGKHSRRGSRLRTHDDSDSSDSESDARKRKIRVVTDPEHNTGPLALLLEQQAKQYQDKSPAFISPDTPNKWGRDEDIISDGKPSRDSLEVPRPTNGFAYIKDHANFKKPPKPRPKSSLTIDNIEPRSSFDNQDSTAPSTPHAKQFGHVGSDPSSPASRSGSQTRKSKRSKFNNIFHSHEHSEEQKHELRPDTAETDKKGKSQQTSEETSDEKHIGTAILAAPGAVMHLLGHRKNDSVSSLPSPEKLRRRETQEPHSAVTRFFKGVKNEGTKVGDIIFRRDRADDSDTDTMSDRNSVEFDDNVATKAKSAKRPTISRISTADTEGSVTSLHKDRNHLDLPSFRPIHSMDDENSDQEHHISRQTRERKDSRSLRLDRLQPPRMDLGTISGNSSQASLGSIHSNSQDRMNQVLARPGATGEDLPPTGLRIAQAASRQRSGSRSGPNGRHWSITDNGDHDGDCKNSGNMITQSDIARVRALFLCSGVKAKEIVRRAQAQRNPPEFLLRAAATSKVQLYPVPTKEEHVLAARILVKDLESCTRALQSTLECFRDRAIQQLTNQISSLQSTVDSDLMPRILEGGDEAVRITSEVSGRGPLQVKQITDEIDRMIRARRRRMRWVRSFGWMLVEWGLVAVMWCVWLIVVLVGSVKRVFGMGLGVIRWLLWL
ncbi:hypothetical protein CFE70_008935 [Pyrenophora teres f. teres 0-1]|nr:hypothetical protein PTNB85_09455 [Pyrenophora teres f. teres]KAE8835393.1 hypothetical protein HRS9122_07663 [Pyrenophora teres f. teres]KAE8861868.1 hypothetical protein PTNB73_07422 [Pyrenophora teres f. teres]